MLCGLLCSALGAHVHGGDIAANSHTDGAAYAAAYRRAYSCAHSAAHCGAHCGTDARADVGTHCDAVGEAYRRSDGRTYRCTDSQAHCCSLGIAHSCAYSRTDQGTDTSSMRRRLAWMP